MLTQSKSRLGVYLIPPYKIAQAVTEIHTMLRKQFGFIAADQFQVHTTLKGFFKKVDGPLEPLIERLDAVFAAQQPLEVFFKGVHSDKVGLGLDVSRQGEDINHELATFREQIVEAVRPFIASDCDFVKADLGNPFRAHITLAFRDIPPDMQADVLAYLQHVPLPTEPFMADTFHLLEFFSQDWPGEWASTLTWRLLKSWRLLQKI